jgi:transposase
VGSPLTVAAAGQNQKRAVFGALEYASGEVISQIVPEKNGDHFVALLKQVAAAWPTDQLVLVLDNVSDHRSQGMKDWWQAQDNRITPFWLPKYCPNLNLIERVWRFLKSKLACHRFWADVAGLQAAADAVLDQVEAHFHRDTAPGIFLRKDLCNSA